MNVSFDFEGGSFLAGVFVGAICWGTSSLWFLPLALIPLVNLELKGMPWMKINYADGKLSVTKGKHK